MKIHTNAFKTNIKEFGRQIDCLITYTINNTEITLTNEDVNTIQPITQGDLLKSIMKELYIDSNQDIPKDTEINFQFGVYDYTEEQYEYLDFGKYYVIKSEYQEDTRSYLITCYDKMINSMVDYEEVPMIYPTTVREYINELCTTIGLTFANASDTFANYDKEIPTDLYKGLGYTYRGVLDELAQVTASNICINEDNELEIRYITDTNETFDEEFFSEDNVKFGKKIGKINSIVLSRSAESDNVYLRDEESVAQNGLYEIKIVDNQIMNFNNRSDFLPDILATLDNLEFYSMDVNSTGICYLDVCDRYTISVNNNSYTCVLMNDEININQGLEENIYVEEPKVSETEYKYADETDRRINQTYIIVNKQQGEITALVSQVDTLQGDLATPTTRKRGEYIDIDDAGSLPLVDLVMEGDTKQDTTTGKQLFDYYTYPTTQELNGITITNNGDGIFTLNGTCNTDNTTFMLGGSSTMAGYCGEGAVTHTAYYISGSCTKAGTSTGRTVIRLNYNQNRSMIPLEQLNSTTNVISKTEPQNTSTSGWAWQIRVDNGDVFNNLKIRYGAEKGSTATEWEEYTGTIPSPNPDFPQPIQTVTGRNEIKITGKNILNVNGIYSSSSTSSLERSYEDGIATLVWTTGFNFYMTVDNSQTTPLKINNTETYTLSFKHKGNALKLRFDESTTDILITNNDADYTTYTYTFTNLDEFVLKFVRSDTTGTAYLKDFMIEKSITATEYEEYKGKTLEINLGKNLFNINAITENKYYDANLNFTDASTYNTSNFITTVSKQLTVSATSTQENPYIRYVLVEFDSSGTALARQVSTSTTALKYTFTIQNVNTTQVRLCYRNDAGLDNIQLEKGSQASTYANYFEPIHLRKKGTHIDYIHKNNNKWYWHKTFDRVVYNGTESGWGNSSTFNSTFTINKPSSMNTGETNMLSNYFYDFQPSVAQVGNYGIAVGSKVNIKNINITDDDTQGFKTWLSTHNVIIDYPLAEPQEVEITNTDLINQLENLMSTSLFRGINHITVDTFDLQPTLEIEYKRDTDVNYNFSNRSDLNNYYTKIETNAQIQVASGNIMTEVEEVRTAVDENSGSISSLSNQVNTLQTSTDYLINVTNEINENGVTKVKTTTNYTFNADGLNIQKSGSSINSKIDNNGFEIKDGSNTILFAGYNTTTQKTEVTSKEMIAEKITAGKHRCEVYPLNNEDKTAWFYVG